MSPVIWAITAEILMAKMPEEPFDGRKIHLGGPLPWRALSFEGVLRDPEFLALPLEAQGLCYRLYAVRYRGGILFAKPRLLALQVGAPVKTIQRLLPSIEGFFQIEDGDDGRLIPLREMPGILGDDPAITPCGGKLDPKPTPEQTEDDFEIDTSKSNNFKPAQSRGKSKHKNHDVDPQSLEAILGGSNSPLIQAHSELSAIFQQRATNQVSSASALARAVSSGTSVDSILEAARTYRKSKLPPVTEGDETRFMVSLQKWLGEQSYRAVIDLTPRPPKKSNRITIDSDAFRSELEDCFNFQRKEGDDEPSKPQDPFDPEFDLSYLDGD